MTPAILPEPKPASKPAEGIDAPLRLHFIDGLRALAVFLVLGTHYLYHTHASCPFHIGQWQGDFFGPFRYGAVGVDLFLVLSGFCLYYPLAVVRNGETRREPTLWEFACRRARRILPPYYASLLLLSLWQYSKSRLHLHVSEIAALPTPGNYLAHIGMVHTLRPEWLYGINPVYWSLGLEWFLYLGFPIFVISFRKFGIGRPVLAVTALALAFQASTAGLLPDDQSFFNTFLFARWPEFVLGMAAAKLIAQGSVARTRYGWVAAALACLTLIVFLVSLQSLSWMQPLQSLLWGAAFFALILAASAPQSALHKILSLRLLVRLGVISYSVYLTHFPMIHLLAAVAKHHLHSGASYLAAWVFLFLPATLLLGYVFHVLFEKPFMAAPQKRIRGTKLVTTINPVTAAAEGAGG